VDSGGIDVETSRQIGEEVRVFDGSKLLEAPETLTLDPEREKQAPARKAALKEWLHARGGQPWFEGIVLECVERFPGLDRFQVTEVICELRDEAWARDEQEGAEESIRRFGVDFHKLSKRELSAIIKAHSQGDSDGVKRDESKHGS
jgi:hypothetical protein